MMKYNHIEILFLFGLILKRIYLDDYTKIYIRLYIEQEDLYESRAYTKGLNQCYRWTITHNIFNTIKNKIFSNIF